MSKILTEEEIVNLSELIYSEEITEANLPFNNYNRVGFTLWAMVQKTMGIFLDAVDKNSDLWIIMTAYKENVFHFAAAKTYQMIRDSRKFLFDRKGVKRLIGPFKSRFKLLENLHNNNWLKAEQVLAQRQSEAARLWIDIQASKAEFPFLQYQTIGDERVRKEHVALDNIVRPVDDIFWNTHYPPNGWYCRCTVIQLAEGEAEITPVKIEAREVEKINPLFNFNSGKENKIFRGSHPYFALAPDEEFRKKENFGFKIPEINNIDNAKTLEI